jgi:hypothetical protein
MTRLEIISAAWPNGAALAVPERGLKAAEGLIGRVALGRALCGLQAASLWTSDVNATPRGLRRP